MDITKKGKPVAAPPIHYLVFDIETVADGTLVSQLKYPGEDLSPEEAIARFRAELMEKYDSDFIPYTYQIPVSVAIAKLYGDLRLADLVVLDEPEFRPHVITDHFWRGWQGYKHPTLVTFNGRSFDMPLLELAAFRYGISVPTWFDLKARAYEQPRNRYNTGSHLDLHDLLTNFGAARFSGGLNLAANLLGKPGKMDVQGHMVQDLYNEGRLQEINDYCRCDVLDTYFVFLRAMVMLGKLKLEGEQSLIAEARQWLEERRHQIDAFSTYLEQWGDWQNPWTKGQEAVENTG
jgi:predicted PolB exonuclease-like 3'-5' exonuclease